MAEQGYVEGKNLTIEQRFADCRYDRMPGLAAELVQLPVDVLFTMGTRATRIVAGVVKTTPLVVYSCDPFEHVTSLARPGGNLTGVTCMTTELMPKRLELLKEALPKASRVMFLHDPEAATNAYKLTQEAAPRLGLRMQAAPVGSADELLPELTMIAKEHPDALLVYPDVVLSSHPRPQQLADFAIKAHLPTVHAFRFYVDAGGLMSYGATTSEIYTSAAEQVAKILKGARPSELPLRQATRFELVINNRTAKALKTHNPTVAAVASRRGDRVIDSLDVAGDDPGHVEAFAITPGRSDRGSSPWSTPRRSPGRTSPAHPSFRRPPPGPGAGSSNRRRDRRACRST
jgi:putative ABC transport system substrate-binding protein